MLFLTFEGLFSDLIVDYAVKEVAFPQSLSAVFGSIKREFAIPFSNIREAINATLPPLDKLKQFLKGGYSHFKYHSPSIDDVHGSLGQSISKDQKSVVI